MFFPRRGILGLKDVALMEEFSCGTRILSGPGAAEALREYGARRLFLVTDPRFMKNGMARRIADLTGAPAVEFFDRLQPDPTVAAAAEGAARLKAFGADLLVALGGGSAIDCAKAMGCFARREYPLAAIPTTSGSGAEVTDSAVLTHGQTRHPLSGRRIRPDLAILDSELLTGLPPQLIADAGFDVLTHALEAYTAKGAGMLSDLYAREAFTVAYAALPASFAGRQEVRLRVHMAACMAGLAFTHAGLGLCHALSHSLGGIFHVPHGQLNAILLPHVIDHNARIACSRYAQLARAAGMPGSTDTAALRNLKDGLLRLRRELELPQSLAQAGISNRELWAKMPRIVEAVLEDPCSASNPMEVQDYLIRRILEQASGGVPFFR